MEHTYKERGLLQMCVMFTYYVAMHIKENG